jgi:hypothetical protein
MLIDLIENTNIDLLQIVVEQVDGLFGFALGAMQRVAVQAVELWLGLGLFPIELRDVAVALF